jgi:hypothetical protein
MTEARREPTREGRRKMSFDATLVDWYSDGGAVSARR